MDNQIVDIHVPHRYKLIWEDKCKKKKEKSVDSHGVLPRKNARKMKSVSYLVIRINSPCCSTIPMISEF